MGYLKLKHRNPRRSQFKIWLIVPSLAKVLERAFYETNQKGKIRIRIAPIHAIKGL